MFPNIIIKSRQQENLKNNKLNKTKCVFQPLFFVNAIVSITSNGYLLFNVFEALRASEIAIMRRSTVFVNMEDMDIT